METELEASHITGSAINCIPCPIRTPVDSGPSVLDAHAFGTLYDWIRSLCSGW